MKLTVSAEFLQQIKERRDFLRSLSPEERRALREKEERIRLMETSRTIAAMMRVRRETDKGLN